MKYQKDIPHARSITRAPTAICSILVTFFFKTWRLRNLDSDVAAGRFREDFFFRINVVRIHLPALRERSADIPLLAESFLAHFARQLNRRVTGFSPEAMALMCAYPWPGNIRELQNAVERAVVIPHAEKDGPPADEAEQLSRWAKTIQSFAAQFPPQGSRVYVNLPGLHSLGRWFTVPPNAGKRLDELLKYELKTQIAFPLEELAWDEMFVDGEPITDIFLQGKAGEVIMALLQEIKRATKHTCA